MTSRYGGAPLCPRCEKAVYMAEQVIGPNGSWHRACLTCFECKKRLDSFALAEHEGEAYCKTCYGRRFGPKGYGFASGTAFLSTENAKPLNNHNNNNHTNNNINRRSSTSSTASSLSSSMLIKDKDESNSDNNILNNKLSQSPPRPPSSLSNYSTSTISSTTSSSSTISNNSSYGFFSTRSYSSPRGSLISGGGGQKRSWTLPVNNDICPRCTKPVYAAEAVLGAGVKYHRLCLRCENCSKLLDSTNMTDRDGKIYCSPCYSKEFGPKGYGYGSGAAFLTTEGAR